MGSAPRNTPTCAARPRSSAPSPLGAPCAAEERPPPADLRLLPPAAGAWVGAALGQQLTVAPAAVTAAVIATLSMLTSRRRRTTRWAAAAGGATLAAGLLVAAVRAPATVAGPITALAAAQSVVVADVVVTGDPQRRATRPGTVLIRSVVLVPVSLRRLTWAGRTIRGRVPALVIATSGSWRGLLPSQHLRLTARLSLPRPGDQIAVVLLARGPPWAVTGASTLQRAAGRLRAGLRAAAAPLPPDERGLFPGLVDGDTSGLTDGVRTDFRTTGLTHLIAVSGANVAIIAAAALGLARWLGLGLRLRGLVALGTIAGFVVLARPSPSVLRAAVMGGLGLIALASGRRRFGTPRSALPCSPSSSSSRDWPRATASCCRSWQLRACCLLARVCGTGSPIAPHGSRGGWPTGSRLPLRRKSQRRRTSRCDSADSVSSRCPPTCSQPSPLLRRRCSAWSRRRWRRSACRWRSSSLASRPCRSSGWWWSPTPARRCPVPRSAGRPARGGSSCGSPSPAPR